MELRGKVKGVLMVRQIFDPMLLVMHNGILSYKRHMDPTKQFDALCICIPEVKLKKIFQISPDIEE